MPNPTPNQTEMNPTKDKIIKDIRNLFRFKKKNYLFEEKIIRDTRTLFQSDEEDYYGPVRIGNAFISNYIKYKCEGNKNKTLPVEEYLDKIRPYLSNIIRGLKT